MTPPTSFWRNALLLSGLLLIAVNLRPSITGIAPLAERMNDSGMSVQIIGLLTTIPLVMFGVAGLFVGAIGGRIGFARALGVGLLILSFACFLRSWDLGGSDGGRIIVSILIGTGIAFGNVLMPGIVKSRFPNQMGLMTSLYSTAMNLGGTIGIALAVPLAASLGGGWNSSLGAWGYAALLPLFLWIPQLLKQPAARQVGNPFAGIMQLLGTAWAMPLRGSSCKKETSTPFGSRPCRAHTSGYSAGVFRRFLASVGGSWYSKITVLTVSVSGTRSQTLI